MKNVIYLSVILVLVSCNSLHRSIKKSSKHRATSEDVVVVTQHDYKEQVIKYDEALIDESNEINFVESTDEVRVDAVETEDVGSIEDVLPNEPVNDPEITEEDVAQRAKYDKNFLFTLITSIIGGPVAVTVGIVTFNSLLMLGIGIPFLLTAFALALFQIYKISHTVPDALVDKKFHRRYIFADVVMIVVAILIGLGLLAGVNAVLSAL